jgi:hypothetical protein
LLFIDGVILFGDGQVREWRYYKHILENFCLATGMEINDNKSLILCNELSPKVEEHILHQYSFHFEPLDNGLKYLGYHLKPNDYRVADWMWLFRKIEARITCWCYRWLTIGGRIVFLKVVLERIPIY